MSRELIPGTALRKSAPQCWAGTRPNEAIGEFGGPNSSCPTNHKGDKCREVSQEFGEYATLRDQPSSIRPRRHQPQSKSTSMDHAHPERKCIGHSFRAC